MLNQDQITSVWERQLAAETRALYFAELASSYTKQKQLISGASFFLASGAAATLLGKFPPPSPSSSPSSPPCSAAPSIARGLDGATRTMSNLQFSWSELASGYERLWIHHLRRRRRLPPRSAHRPRQRTLQPGLHRSPQ